MYNKYLHYIINDYTESIKLNKLKNNNFLNKRTF